MSCSTPCSNCSCETTPCSDCSCESVYTSGYQEVDSSPLATLQKRFFEEYEAAPKSPVNFFERECAKDPHAKGCLIYD